MGVLVSNQHVPMSEAGKASDEITFFISLSRGLPRPMHVYSLYFFFDDIDHDSILH